MTMEFTAEPEQLGGVKVGDRVEISSPRLGLLMNRVTTSRDAAPWGFGIRQLMRATLARRKKGGFPCTVG